MSVTETKRKETNDEDEIEIRLSNIVRFLKRNRWRILVFTLVGFVLGLVYAFSIENQYSAQVRVLPEMESKGGGLNGLGSLAGLAGIDIGGVAGGGMDAIRPDIYPDVLHSVPFALYLLKQPVYSQLLTKETTLESFLKEKSGRTLISNLFGSKANEDTSPVLDPNHRSKTLEITKFQEVLVRQVHKSVSATFDKKTGLITVSSTLPDPVVAATVARLSLEYLTNYITSYRTEKARNQVRFLTHQVEDTKKRYQVAEYALSNYRDKNRGLFLNTAKIEEQKLQSDFLLAQNVYGDLSKQLEQAKIKVEEQSPVFKILEPAQIPLKKSGPNRILTILSFVVLGSVFGTIFCVIRTFIFKSAN
ncbi:lipopolysaccharide biosynthesis protein [Spirosoma aureum]|uniref:Lipopolysaccharide biosynthesis protein n=1 Tax=Spirosoma aureum TaxID=2692134 RepID=A0A6G9AI70_9BACT|nr:Wzz/FepE/Etk N-terminal domain-containing protein [Spirosoma aureum]QIP12019.1 lipopolysaccharide biosynthesis protein [Spirosoma aureum]